MESAKRLFGLVHRFYDYRNISDTSVVIRPQPRVAVNDVIARNIRIPCTPIRSYFDSWTPTLLDGFPILRHPTKIDRGLSWSDAVWTSGAGEVGQGSYL